MKKKPQVFCNVSQHINELKKILVGMLVLYINKVDTYTWLFKGWCLKQTDIGRLVDVGLKKHQVGYKHWEKFRQYEGSASMTYWPGCKQNLKKQSEQQKKTPLKTSLNTINLHVNALLCFNFMVSHEDQFDDWYQRQLTTFSSCAFCGLCYKPFFWN